MNSVEKALKILQAFVPDHPVWGVRELSAHLQFSPATAQRILQTLKADGFVDQDSDSRQYRLGSIFYRFLTTLQEAYPFARSAQPAMKQLLAKTRETVHLNVIQENERVCIDALESPQSLRGSMPVGNTSPLYAGASSKCLLAFSPPEFIARYLSRIRLKPITDRTVIDPQRLRSEIRETRQRGYACSLGERIPDLGSLSAPICDHRGNLLGAVSLAIPGVRYRDETHRQFCLDRVLDTAWEISRLMGCHGSGRTEPGPTRRPTEKGGIIRREQETQLKTDEP